MAEPDDKALPEPRPPITFVHIPKTATGAVRSMFAAAYGRHALVSAGNYLRDPERATETAERMAPGMRVTIGPTPYALFAPHLPMDTRYVTFLREPVDRVIAHYAQHRRRSDDTLEQALARGLPELTNLMTRFLCSHTTPGPLPDRALEEAEDNLEDFTFVGLHERFDESLVLLQEALGLPPTPYVAGRDKDASRHEPEEFGDEQRELIREHNRLDVELYAYARERFDAAAAERGEDLGGAVESLRGVITARAEEQEEQTERALAWLTAAAPPGSTRPYKELRAQAARLGFTGADLKRARRLLTPSGKKVETPDGVMFVVKGKS